MEEYNYLEAVKEDVLNYIKENVSFEDFEDRDELEDFLNDTLWTKDSVTGYASGSYYCNSWKAADALAHNWDVLKEALENFGDDSNPIEEGEEWCDVTIRRYLLPRAISNVLDTIEDKIGVYTMTQWEKDRNFEAIPGGKIEEEIYEAMMNVLPPLELTKDNAKFLGDTYNVAILSGFLMGEPCSTDKIGNLLYRAFGQDEEHCYYLGLVQR